MAAGPPALLRPCEKDRDNRVVPLRSVALLCVRNRTAEALVGKVHAPWRKKLYTAAFRAERAVATRPPIRALKEVNRGWRTLTAWVSGGGILNPYEAALPFDGASYPTSAAPPAPYRVPGNAEGQVIISESQPSLPVAGLSPGQHGSGGAHTYASANRTTRADLKAVFLFGEASNLLK
jgi:hypothetical protein